MFERIKNPLFSVLSVSSVFHYPFMKRLYLVRHAKSSWKDHAVADFDRPLNKRGFHDAPLMGQRLAARKIRPDLILCSPAKRALTTATIIARELAYPEARIVTDKTMYEAGSSRLLHIIRQLDNSMSEVMLVGHNPSFTVLSEELSGEMFDNVPTCGIVCLEFEVASWQEIKARKGALRFFDYPKKED